jgi:hypothetical protein
MTNFISRFFQKNTQASMNTSTNPIPETIQGPPASLFVDLVPPTQELNIKKVQTNEVRDFLNKNHFLNGRSMGYQLHCHDGLDDYLSAIRTEFREAADQLIAHLSHELLQCKMTLNEMGDMLPSLRQNLQLSIEQIQNNIEEVRLQKVLSADDEGWVASAVRAFTRGYKQGLHDYMSEKDFMPAALL